MKLRRRDLSFVVIVACATLTGIWLVDTLFGLRVSSLMACRSQEMWAVIEAGGPTGIRQWWAVATLWTSALAHSGAEHLVSNLIFFWLFGTLLSQLAGERWVLVALLITPVTANIAWLWQHADGTGAVLGASGVVSGISGLYVLLSFRWDAPEVFAWPLARPVPPLQAAVAAIIAAALDIYVLQAGDGDGVAHASHIGGFAGGLLLGAILTTIYPTYERFRGAPAGSG